MNRIDIIKELGKRGYEAITSESIKNGVTFKGIIIRNGNVSPIIYTDRMIERAEENGLSAESVATEVIEIFEANKECNIDISSLFDKDFVLSHIYIGIQRESDEDLERGICDYEGLETYLYIKVSENTEGNATVKVKSDLLDRVEISSAEAWEHAEDNTNKDTVIESMAKIFAKLQGLEYEPFMDDLTPMWVISNKSRVKGASAILDRDALQNFAEEKGVTRLVVLPSSVHEMIILPYEGSMNIEDFNEMVKEVNANEVKPEERLTDRAYFIEL